MIINSDFDCEHRFKKEFPKLKDRNEFVDDIQSNNGQLQLTKDNTYQIQLENNTLSIADTNKSYINTPRATYPLIALIGFVCASTVNMFIGISIMIFSLMYFVFTYISSRIYTESINDQMTIDDQTTIPIKKYTTKTNLSISEVEDNTSSVQEVVLNRTKTEDSIIFKLDDDVTWTIDINNSNWELQELYTIVGFENVAKDYVTGYVTNSDSITDKRAIESDCGNWKLTEL